MEHRHEEWLNIVTFMAAAILLFVVLFPYTPTPIALSIDKILVAVAVLHACLLFSPTLTIPRTPYGFHETSSRFSSDEILDLICVRLR